LLGVSSSPSNKQFVSYLSYFLTFNLFILIYHGDRKKYELFGFLHQNVTIKLFKFEFFLFRHVDVVNSDETQPSWSVLDTGQLTTGYQTGQNSTGAPGSTNVGTSGSTLRGFRKNSNASKKNFPDSSGHHHLAADSGFSTETRLISINISLKVKIM